MIWCCISFDSYIKPQLAVRAIVLWTVVYLLIPTSNHNLHTFSSRRWNVVYLLIPTSNHNTASLIIVDNELYIFWFLHQTTTATTNKPCIFGCISFDSYIKPQPGLNVSCAVFRCISFDSYIKPQLIDRDGNRYLVVYLLIPTSNHNRFLLGNGCHFVVYLLIPTSNHNCHCCASLFHLLYIFWFLHQTTTFFSLSLDWPLLYIFWFLHQTTTLGRLLHHCRGLYIFWFLHQTTTYLYE